MQALLRDLGPRLRIVNKQLILFARAQPENHPCTRFGGFDTPEQMASSGNLEERPKGASGWSSIQEMLEAEVDQAKAHGISGLGQLEGITDDVWRLSSLERVPVVELAGHRLTHEIDMSAAAVEKSTPASPQGAVVSYIRSYGNGIVGAIELPARPLAATLPPWMRIRHRERHLIAFPERVQMRGEYLGPWRDAIPLHSR
jgi:hypothetical protein